MFGSESEIIGIDTSQLQIDISKKKIKEYGVNAELISYDGKQLPFSDNSFDIVHANQAFKEVDNIPYCLDEFYRVLRAGGAVTIYTDSNKHIDKLLKDSGFKIEKKYCIPQKLAWLFGRSCVILAKSKKVLIEC